VSKLRNQVAVVTGAASGVGQATAELFAAEGAQVVGLDIAADRLEDVMAAIRGEGGAAVGIATDLTEPAEVEGAVASVIEDHGGVDVLVNVAGIEIAGNVVSQTLEDWHAQLGINLTAIFLTCKHAIPSMLERGGGSIVNVACVAGLYDAERNLAGYCASKGGAILLTKQIAIDYARAGIRANCICPGWVDTPHNEPVVTAGAQHDLDDYIDRYVPMGRQGTAREVADAALFLASAASSGVTGTTLAVDAGLSAQLAAPYIQTFPGAPSSP
jgi:NAD(P)-dependent dehydrogenase (short-subunit alcohol dehydrogenase family)